jgi:hypothetical protein
MVVEDTKTKSQTQKKKCPILKFIVQNSRERERERERERGREREREREREVGGGHMLIVFRSGY